MSVCQYCNNFIPALQSQHRPKCTQRTLMRQEGPSRNSMMSLFTNCSKFEHNPQFVEA